MVYGDELHRESGRLISSAFIGTGVVIFRVKEIVRRKRPLDTRLGNPAFASGHTAYTFAAATVRSDRYPKLQIPFYIGAGLVGHSRMNLGIIMLRMFLAVQPLGQLRACASCIIGRLR